MLIDEVEILVRSGKGGNGMMHFRREKFVPRGGPDGGSGGRGGDVILKVVPTLNTLSAFHHKTQFFADDGKSGSSKNQTGHSAENLIIQIPPGTIVHNSVTGELLGDMVENGQELRICKGGRGGRGNTTFASSTNQAPRTAERGEPGEELSLKLVLKLIADVGIVGVPNAGKSSFLAAVTNARPKIADYPFTTIEPNLGVAELDETTNLVLADIPGLIEGAHRGVGLGNTFLRHTQRTRVLIHVLDGLSSDPIADFTQVNSEMALFDPFLIKKPQIVALNKMDLPDVRERWQTVKEQLEKMGYQPMAISVVSHENLKPILWKAFELLKNLPQIETAEEIPVYRFEEDPRSFTISQEPDGWRVKGAAIERAANMTYWEYQGSVRRFQKLMEKLGVEQALRQAGVQQGDTVFIGDNELDWQD
jgi:GTPase